MANITTTETAEGRKRGALRKTLWFVGLWCAGVAGAMLLALPFRILIHAAMH
jgi:hypothetical protein